MTEERLPQTFEDFLPTTGKDDIFTKVHDLAAHLAAAPNPALEGLGLQVLGPAAPEVRIRERDGTEHPTIMLGSNSYLGLTTHPRVLEAAAEALRRYGYGMGAVSLYAGTSDLHRELEEQIAAFLGTEEAMIFPCGYSGNVGIITALCGPGDVVINDTHNHASIFDGGRLSGADLRIFLHRNMAHLERTLKRLPDDQRGRLVVTDGVFSMHGDLAPLDEMVELCSRYRARLMVDDAHGLGVVGPTGRGTAEQFDCMARVDVQAGTLSKAPGAVGGYCAGSSELVRYLRLYARTYFFSTSLPAPVVAGLIEVFKLLAEDAAGRQRLWHNIRHLVRRLHDAGFDTGETASAIVPVIVGDEDRLARIHTHLRARGIFTNLVSYPAVRRRECRLRLSVMSDLSTAQLDRAVDALIEASTGDARPAF